MGATGARRLLLPLANPYTERHDIRRNFLIGGTLDSVSRLSIILAVILTLLSTSVAQETPRMSLEYSEPMFTVMAAINACGYDQDLATSLPIRQQVRAEVVQAAQTTQAQNALAQMCKYYVEHRQADNSRTLAQYVSLALNLGEAPAFTPKVKEADLPPDAANVLGFVPLLQTFYVTTELNRIYRSHIQDYERLVDQFREPITNLLVSTDVYLKKPMSGYVGRNFLVYLEPLAAPGQTNSRNYGDDYFVVLSPEARTSLEQVRHTYLHFVLDPLALKRANQLNRLSPILDTVADAPLAASYKQDVALLVTESLIRAVEARTLGGVKGPERQREEQVERSMREGFVLTRHFYETLIKYEKDEVGLREAYPDWLFGIDLGREMKRAGSIQFASSSTPEVVGSGRRQQLAFGELAERALTDGNFDAAAKYAQQSLDKGEDAGRALFVLARASTLQGRMEEARKYFERTIGSAKDSRTLAWSHIYLGRIFDLQQDRHTALQHYRAALLAGDKASDTKAAAERGIEKPYAPPARSQQPE